MQIILLEVLIQCLCFFIQPLLRIKIILFSYLIEFLLYHIQRLISYYEHLKSQFSFIVIIIKYIILYQFHRLNKQDFVSVQITYQTLKDYPDDLQGIDYYTILNISKKDAEDIELLKKHYKKQAVKFHPDRQKTPEYKQKAHDLFALLQAAYKTLIDPQEKAYYDRNKDILHDKETQDFFQRESITIDLSKYMTGKQINQNPIEFYKIVNQITNQISHQEFESARILMKLTQNGSIKVTNQHYQRIVYRYTNTLRSFGDDASQNVDVLDFYSQWGSFQTVKLFKSADRYNSEGENSKIRGLVDKENETFRAAARNAYNSEVRAFIEYIQQFDKRLERIQHEKAVKQNYMKEQIQNEIQMRKQAKIDKQNEARIQYENRVKELEDKLFKNTISQAEILEYEKLTLQGSQSLIEKEKMWIQQEKQRKDQQQNQQHNNKDMGDQVDYNANISKEDRDLGLRYNSQTKKLFCNICKQQFQMQGQFKTHLTSKKHKKALDELKHGSGDNDCNDNSIGGNNKASKSNKQQQINKNDKQDHDINQVENIDNNNANDKSDNTVAKQAQNQFKCLKCKASFPSKTKLFEHIRKTGHAALKVDVDQVQAASSKKHRK